MRFTIDIHAARLIDQNGKAHLVCYPYSGNGIAGGIPSGHFGFSNAAGNYTTAVVGNVSIAFIQRAVAAKKPFFAYVAPKAAHEPFNPAPWYEGHWEDTWPKTEPRTPNWNASFASRADHHGNIATEPLISVRFNIKNEHASIGNEESSQ